MSIEGKIYETAKVVGASDLILGKRSQIDDFCFINTGELCKIGRNVHIASFTSVIGGGRCIIEDFVGVSAGCRLITATDDFSGPYLTGPTVPSKFTNVISGQIHIKKHAIVGTNTVIYPNVTIGEGTAVAAGSIVRKDLEPWTVYVMQNGKMVALKKRDKTSVLKLEQEYLGSIDA